ncbi:Plasmodium vivax Vir protein, putative [Plasmodium vivax]|uniref:Vir protein, putative n=1 Tax=Plasmodium vivax TaxID=5855 RepID=A0A1G4E4C2_PLAVI|nr:Plasmodium vivax Vir protein, putative [Plasmodium vivax]
MSYEKFIGLSELNKLINRLHDKEGKRFCVYTTGYLHSIEETNNKTLKNIGPSLECAYSFVTAHSGKPLIDLCKYLNLWLDEQKGKHVNDESDVSNEDWKTVENLWERLKGEQDTHYQCVRQYKEKNISDISKRIDLMSYCMNRDYFKRLLRSSGRSDSYKKEICKSFSDYTNDYYNKLIEGIGCINNRNDNNVYKYEISEDCTLYNIPKTFPKCEAHSLNIVENDNSKKNIICETNAKVGSVGPESVESLAELAKRDGVPDKLLQTDDDPGERLETRGDPVKLPEAARASADLTELYLTPPTVVSSNDNGTSKTIYYSGLSASGVFFTSMVLYKYTTLGPLIRSLVSKKEKLRQTTNKHLAQQWLQTTSEYMDDNSENVHYNFPYHSMQN